jgi:hypothetical protein
MKRNMNLIKEILLEVEATPCGISWFLVPFIEKREYPEDEVNFHFGLLFKANFIEKNRGGAEGISCLTWSGYELLDSIRDKDFGEMSMALWEN